MYRIVKSKVHGVLTDYDLASWTNLLTKDYTNTSQQRTGTPPFMAFGLLDGSDALHLYRHDVESLFYVMVILATHYEVRGHRKGETGGVRMRQGELPFEEWFDEPSYKSLASFKHTFLSKAGYLELSPTFKDFHDWLLKLHTSFFFGIQALDQRGVRQRMRLLGMPKQAGDDVNSTAFDEETLGGNVHYSALIDPARDLEGKLKGLVIRYGR